MDKPRILLAIPAYGGNIMVQCFNSVLKLYKNKELNEKYEISTLTVHNEALISRARQEIAKAALMKKVDKLFFIDADISFTEEDFLKIVDADKPVVGGTYMKKSLSDPGLNFSISSEMDKEFILKHGTAPSNLDGFEILKSEYCSESPLIKAKYIPTGFMCIKKEVLEKLHDVSVKYLSDRRSNQQVVFTEEEVKKMQVAEMFPVSVQNNILESEDWGFCRLCAENNIDVYLHTEVVVEHHGLIVFHPRHFRQG